MREYVRVSVCCTKCPGFEPSEGQGRNLLCYTRVCVCVCVCDGSSASPAGCTVAQQSTMVEPEHRASAAQRLGAQETLGISTLDPGHRPPIMPPGRHVSIKIRMLDDTEEVFDVSVSSDWLSV